MIENKFFDDERFCNYLEYLTYFKSSEYIQYVRYPLCLKILEKILDKDFIIFLSQKFKEGFANDLNWQLWAHWIQLSDFDLIMKKDIQYNPPPQSQQHN